MLKMELPGKRKRGWPKRGFMDMVREDMQVVSATEEDAEDRKRWSPLMGTAEEEDCNSTAK